MATKFSSTILASNLDSLKDKASELARSLEEINSAAGTAGNALSDMTKGALGDVQNLTSQISRLNSALQRTSTTSSAIGAASVSSALGHLTGQGRGGGGGGGGAGGGGFAPTMGGGAVGMLGGLLDKLPFGLGKLAKGPAAAAKFVAGMTMSGLQQGRNARLGWERSRYYSPIAGLGKYGSARKDKKGNVTGWNMGGIGQFSGFARMGFDASRGAEITEGLLGAMGGRGGGVDDALATTQFGLKYGMTPEALNPLAGALTVGGGDIGQLYGQQKMIGRQAGMTTQQRLRGMYFPNQNAKITANRAERFRNAKFLAGQTAGFYEQQGQQFGHLTTHTQQTIPGMLGAIGRATDQPKIAGQLLNALRQGTLAPGGGEAGKVFQLQAAGFGNPYLAGERQTAERLGIDPSSLQRRDYLQAQKFVEKEPSKSILNQMVGVAHRMRGADPLMQGHMLKQVAPGLSLTHAEELMGALQGGKFSTSQILEQIDTSRGHMGPEKGDLTRKTGYAGSAFMKQQAELSNVLLAVSKDTETASAALNQLQKALYRLAHTNAGKAVGTIEKIITALGKLTAGDVGGAGTDTGEAIRLLADLIVSLKDLPALTRQP